MSTAEIRFDHAAGVWRAILKDGSKLSVYDPLGLYVCEKNKYESFQAEVKIWEKTNTAEVKG
jgi:hypothetical protein